MTEITLVSTVLSDSDLERIKDLEELDPSAAEAEKWSVLNRLGIQRIWDTAPLETYMRYMHGYNSLEYKPGYCDVRINAAIKEDDDAIRFIYYLA